MGVDVNMHHSPASLRVKKAKGEGWRKQLILKDSPAI
jgi:hypothetical protein